MSRVVVFRTSSDAEASIVRGLLESHGLDVRQEQAGLRHVFPLPASPFGEIALTVDEEDAGEARRVLDTASRDPLPGELRVVPFHDDLAAFEQRKPQLEMRCRGRRFEHECALQQCDSVRVIAGGERHGGFTPQPPELECARARRSIFGLETLKHLHLCRALFRVSHSQ